jgi:hypothetical protein
VRPAILYCRAHQALEALIVIGAASGFAMWHVAKLNAHFENLPAVFAFSTLASGLAIGLSEHEAFGEIERSSSGKLLFFRFGLIAGGLFVSSLALIFAVGSRDLSINGVLVRNVIGFTGLCSWCAVWLGARPSWLPPVLVSIAAYLTDTARTPNLFPHILWGWPLARANNLTAAAISAIFGLGIVVVAVRGPKLDPFEFDV